jgi:FtsH-binding integral membrane protein
MANEIVKRVIATESLLLFALSIGAALLAIACIFLFKNRPLQFKLSVVGVILSIIIIGLEVWHIENFRKVTTLVRGSYYWGGLMPIAMAVCFILAARAIYKDEKMIKSLNRLR